MSLKSILVALSAGALVLAGCSSRPSSNGSANPDEVASEPADIGSYNAAILAAAEPFENLTEQAPTASADTLKSLIQEAGSGAAKVYSSLDKSARANLQNAQTKVNAAATGDDRAGIALAAVEGYRTLVESVRGNTPIPMNVSLLDYAGFRYQADLSSDPARWDDALKAVDFAGQQWAEISSRVADATLRDDFSKALSAMRKAAGERNLDDAHRAVTGELDLVDKLEQFFSQKP